MGNVVAQPQPHMHVNFNLKRRSYIWQVGAVVVGTLFLALSSYVSIPLSPIPFTMQTFAVAMIGALYGWRLGGITIIAWLAEAALGAPVLAGGLGGLAAFTGPTAGYLIAFPFAGALMGWLAERGWDYSILILGLVAMLISHVICLAFGGIWLSTLVGAHKAIALGVTPFLGGMIVKSLLGAVTLKILASAKIHLRSK